MSIQFSCTGCGQCCTGHHVPLTLAESRQWASDGGEVIVLIEAVVAQAVALDAAQARFAGQEHQRLRSQAVSCGGVEAQLSIIFAAYNPGRCRNLQADNGCAIYAHRPLVCRIYPAEINPHVAFEPTAKDCPTEAWSRGAVLFSDGVWQDHELARTIAHSRQADRDDIASKVKVCEQLGLTTTALKGAGFITALPTPAQLLAALDALEGEAGSDGFDEWGIHTPDPAMAAHLRQAGARMAELLDPRSSYLSLRG